MYLCLKCSFPQCLKFKSLLCKQISSITHNIWKRGYSKDFWIEPDGYPTGIKITNSMTNSVVELKTLRPNILTWFICGPTVYDSAHIGHASCYMRLDIIRRIIESVSDLTVLPVMGMTDIDDKLLIRAVDEESTVKAIAMKYEKEFIEDLTNLNILQPKFYTRVTDHMPQIVAFIEKIVARGYAYKTDKTVYFDSKALERYNKLVRGNGVPNEETAEESDKKYKLDFALWKIVNDQHIKWPSPWGDGRPGWHIECSAMASQVFGDKLDLHSGGSDLIFPHHESEEAQCCARHGTDQWCNYWNHVGLLSVKNDVKMSKSLQNTISIATMLENTSADVFRMFCVTSHYKTFVEYSEESMQSSHERLKRIIYFLESCNSYLSGQVKCPDFNENDIIKQLNETKIAVRSLLTDDFQTGFAVENILNLIQLCNKAFSVKSQVGFVSGGLSVVAAVNDFIVQFMNTLGFKMESISSSRSLSTLNPHLPKLITSTVAFRSEMRNFALGRGNFKNDDLSKQQRKDLINSRKPIMDSCDAFRTSLGEYGVKVKDDIDHSTWSLVDENLSHSENVEQSAEHPPGKRKVTVSIPDVKDKIEDI